MDIYTKRGHGQKKDIHQDKTIDYSKRKLYKQKTMWNKDIQIKRGLYGKETIWKGGKRLLEKGHIRKENYIKKGKGI